MSVPLRGSAVPGDADADGKVTLADARLVTQYYLTNGETADADGVTINMDNADANNDGVISISDASMIVTLSNK